MNQLFNNINFYPNKIPQINENVLVVFNEYKNTHIEATLLEYININGLIIKNEFHIEAHVKFRKKYPDTGE